MNHNLELFIILVASGIFGGIVSFFSTKAKDEPVSKNIELIKSIIIGIAASLLVPLFLNTISSNLIIESETDDNKIFIIIGFCLVASISSKAFIQIMTSKVIKELNEVRQNLEHVKKDVNEIVSNETESEHSEGASVEIAFDTTDDRYKILKALSESKYIYRSLGGLNKETKINKDIINQNINKLVQQGLVEQTTKANGVRFFITTIGRQLLANNELN
ncbi:MULTISPECIES: YEATS-associated helix-containing protein [Paenibacillus]|uniref:YEATS-associated helix-containing protein n=1 Tax=Paenibacillus TaxID=44249 RepID=UPI002866C999|nr:YEATS-associated helix-containing protein [Paenibacillus sp. 2003]MDR6715547.1 DNA-binding MarR family transcriptional regulator [Paenibacillus sp. 2003]